MATFLFGDACPAPFFAAARVPPRPDARPELRSDGVELDAAGEVCDEVRGRAAAVDVVTPRASWPAPRPAGFLVVFADVDALTVFAALDVLALSDVFALVVLALVVLAVLALAVLAVLALAVLAVLALEPLPVAPATPDRDALRVAGAFFAGREVAAFAAGEALLPAVVAARVARVFRAGDFFFASPSPTAALRREVVPPAPFFAVEASLEEEPRDARLSRVESACDLEVRVPPGLRVLRVAICASMNVDAHHRGMGGIHAG